MPIRKFDAIQNNSIFIEYDARSTHANPDRILIFHSPHTSTVSDAELLDRFRLEGRVEALGMLYDRYIPLVYGMCLKYLRSSDEAEDAVMAIYEQLQQRVARYEIREFRTWLYSVVRNHCLQWLRRHNRTIALENEAACVESDPILHLLDESDQSRRDRTLQHCLERLPEPQRRSISLFFFDERSYADIVALTGWALKSVKSYLQNGKRNLKLCIEKASER